MFKYEKVSEMKSTEVSDILAPKCRPTSDVSLSKEVSETAVEVVTSASSSIICAIRSLTYICILCVLGSVHVQVVMYP